MIPPPPPNINTKNKSVIIGVSIVAVVAIIVSAFLLMNYFNQPTTNPSTSPNPTQSPDISGIRIIETTPVGRMETSGTDTYHLVIYTSVKIKNPTSYDATIRLYGDCNVTLYGDVSIGESLSVGNHVAHGTQDFILPSYSENIYILSFYNGNVWYVNSNSITVTFNNYHIEELWRGIGSPP